MIAQTATIACMRGDPMQVVLRVNGVDLTGATLALAVGLNVDPLGRKFVLGMALAAGAEGIRLVRVDQGPEGLPLSVLEIIAGKPKLADLPKGGELGDDTLLWFDLQTDRLNLTDDLTDVEVTLLRGPFIVKGSIND